MNLELIVLLTVLTLSTATIGFQALPQPYEKPTWFSARSQYRFGIGDFPGTSRIDLPDFGFGYAGMNFNANNNFNNNFINNRSFSNYISYNGFTDDYGRKDTDDYDNDIYISDEDDDDDDDDSYQYGYRLYRDDNRRGYYENSDSYFNDMYSGNGYTGNVDKSYVNMNNYVGFNRYTSNRPGYMNKILRRPFWGYRSSSMRVSNKPHSSFFIPFLPKKSRFHTQRLMFKPVLPLIRITKPFLQWRLPVLYQRKKTTQRSSKSILSRQKGKKSL